MLTTRGQGGLRAALSRSTASALPSGGSRSGRPPGTRLGRCLPHGPSDPVSWRGSVCLLGWARAFLRGLETPVHVC